MDLGIFGKLIENVAPTIATALGGPVAFCGRDAPDQSKLLPQNHAALFATSLGVGLSERCL